jgi:hypothetical protein
MTQTPAGRVLTGLIGQSQTDTELASAYRALYSTGRRELAAVRLHRAQQLGQLGAGIDVQVIVDQLWGAVDHRLLIPDEPVTQQFVTALISNPFDGISAGES